VKSHPDDTLKQQMITETHRQELRDFINFNEIKLLAGKK
jgi:hypothetical protein